VIKKTTRFFFVLLGCAILTACYPKAEPTTLPPQIPSETALPLAETPLPEPTLSFPATTYEDLSMGIRIDYPSGWTVIPKQKIGDRGSQTVLLSPGSSIEALAEGGSRVTLVDYLWDPKNDLAAYAAQRKIAWEASGSVILSEESRELSDGRKVMTFLIETPDKLQSLIALTTGGEDYLQISAEGNLGLCREILGSLRLVD
jgi:hypothetical protein